LARLVNPYTCAECRLKHGAGQLVAVRNRVEAPNVVE
jgi:hypothetical protein